MSVQIIGYLSFGYPDIETSILRAGTYVEAGCDCLEIDFPSDNAFLDSDFIKARMHEAYAVCSDYDKYFAGIAKINALHRDIKKMALCYEQTVRKIGTEYFAENLMAQGVQDLILVGNENAEVKEKLIGLGMKVSSYVPFDLNDAAVNDAKTANGFIYLQAKPAGKIREGYDTLAKCVEYLRAAGIENPIYCGMGVSTPADIEMIKAARGDGAFIGSALLKLKTNEEIKAYIGSLKQKA